MSVQNRTCEYRLPTGVSYSAGIVSAAFESPLLQDFVCVSAKALHSESMCKSNLKPGICGSNCVSTYRCGIWALSECLSEHKDGDGKVRWRSCRVAWWQKAG